MVLLFGDGGIVEDAQNGAIRDRTQGPLPVIVIGNSARGAELHHSQQSVQRDVDVEAGAGTNADFLAQRWKKRWRGHSQRVDAGEKAGSGVVSSAVGENCEGVIGGAEDLHNGAHLRIAGSIANVSGNRSGPRSGPKWKRHSKYNRPSSERAQSHSTHPWEKLQGATLRQTSLTDQQFASRRYRSP